MFISLLSRRAKMNKCPSGMKGREIEIVGNVHLLDNYRHVN